MATARSGSSPSRERTGCAVVPGGEQVEHALADGFGFENAAVEEDGAGLEVAAGLLADEGGEGFAGFDVLQAAGEETGEVLADDRIGRVGQAEFLEGGTAGFERDVGDAGHFEETVEHDLLEGRAVELGREGAGEEAGAAGRDGDGGLVERGVGKEGDFRDAGGVDEGEELPVVDGFSGVFELGAQGVGEREVHVVAAEQEVLADADAFEREISAARRDGDEAEIRGAAADVADEHDVAGADLGAPIGSGLGGPGVERGLRFFEQDDVGQARGFGGFVGEVSGDFVEGGGDGEDDLALGEVPIAALGGFGVEKSFFEMCQVAAGAFEGGEFSFDGGSPRQDRLAGIDVGIGEPGFRRGDEAVGNQGAVLAGEMADDPGVGRPRQFHGVGGKFLRIRDVERGGERRHFADLVRREDLGDFDDGRVSGLEIRDRDGAVAGAEVDAEAELETHGERGLI